MGTLCNRLTAPTDLHINFNSLSNGVSGKQGGPMSAQSNESILNTIGRRQRIVWQWELILTPMVTFQAVRAFLDEIVGFSIFMILIFATLWLKSMGHCSKNPQTTAGKLFNESILQQYKATNKKYHPPFVHILRRNNAAQTPTSYNIFFHTYKIGIK